MRCSTFDWSSPSSIAIGVHGLTEAETTVQEGHNITRTVEAACPSLLELAAFIEDVSVLTDRLAMQPEQTGDRPQGAVFLWPVRHRMSRGSALGFPCRQPHVQLASVVFAAEGSTARSCGTCTSPLGSGELWASGPEVADGIDAQITLLRPFGEGDPRCHGPIVDGARRRVRVEACGGFDRIGIPHFVSPAAVGWRCLSFRGWALGRPVRLTVASGPCVPAALCRVQMLQRSMSSPVTASTSAHIRISATGGVTALPYWRTFSRLEPSTV